MAKTSKASKAAKLTDKEEESFSCDTPDVGLTTGQD
jgi:hypothetical protein